MLHSAKVGDATVAVEISKDNVRPKVAKEEGAPGALLKRSDANVVESMVKAAVSFECEDTDHFAEEYSTAEPHLKQQVCRTIPYMNINYSWVQFEFITRRAPNDRNRQV